MKWKEFLKTPKGRLTAALCLLGISWIFLFFNFVGPIDTLMPTDQDIASKKDALQKLQKENNTLKQKMKKQKELDQHYQNLIDRSWQQHRDGVIETELRYRVQDAAQKANLNLNSLGSVKIVKINNNLSYAEIDLQGAAPIEVIAGFLSQIDKISPRLNWKRFDLRMNMRPRNFGTQATVQNLNHNGTLRVIYSGGQGDNK